MGSSYRKGLVLSLGSIVQTTVDLHSAIPSNRPATGMHRMCPEHHLQLKQTHKCPEGDHEVSQWVMGKATDGGGLKIAPDTTRPQTPAVDILEMKPIPAKELDDNTLYGSNIYYLKPTMGTTQAWLAMTAIVGKGQIALVSKGALRAGGEKLWRLDRFRDYLVLRDIVFPEDIRDVPETVDEKLEKGTMSLISQFMENLVTSWDDMDTVDRSREQLKAWIEQGDTVVHDQEVIDRSDAAQSLVDQLREAIEK